MKRWAVVVPLLAWAGTGAAQQALQPYQEYDKRMRAAEQVGALTSDLFGEQVSLYDRQTSFEHVDIDLPGNHPLPVRLARRLEVRPRAAVGMPPEPYAGAGDWDIAVPYIAGTFDSAYGWNATSSGAQPRCSSNFYPHTNAPHRIEEIWSGYSVHVPGRGTTSLMGHPDASLRPSDGQARLWITRELDAFSCTPMASGYPGEGFVMLTTEGVKYTFNVGTTRFAGSMGRDSSTMVSRSRIQVFLLASRIEDRFGNWVAYTYNGNGHPTRIEASDGRRVDLAYADGRLSTATAHGRQWSYQYASGRLSGVVLPDQSSWTIAHSSDMRIAYERWTESAGPECSNIAPFAEKSYGLVLTHPSGAVGTFQFDHRRHYRSGVPRINCVEETLPSGELGGGVVIFTLAVPNYSDVLGLTRKTLSGPGLAPLQWTYADDGQYQGLWSGVVPPCTTCTPSKGVTVTQPDGSKRQETYGIVYGHNEGKLLQARTVAADGSVLETQSLAYVSEAEAAGQPFPDRYGAAYGGDPYAPRIRPLRTRTITRQGVDFVWQVEGFDVYGHPVQVLKSSTGTGAPSRREATEYHHDTAQWILGQVKRVTCLGPSVPAGCATAGTELSRADYEPAYGLPIRIYRFGKLHQTLGYDTASSVASGQRGTVKTVADGNGNVTTLTNWKRGTPQAITHPATPESPSGATQSAVVNDSGWITSVTDENGFTTSYGYDVMGRLNLIDYPNDDTVNWANTTLALEYVASAEYGIPAGHWRHTVSTGNGRKVSYFDALWRPLVVREYDTGNVAGTQRFIRSTYDHEGRVTFASYPGTSDALTAGTWTYYDALGRPVQSTQDSELGPLTTTTEYLSGFRTRVTPPRGQGQGATFQTTTSYLAWDQPTTDYPVAIAHPAGAFTDIARDVFGKPTAITRRDSVGLIAVTRNYVYDEYQQLCKSVEPETGATIMAYDTAGNLLWSKAGATQTGTSSCNTTDIPTAQRTIRTYDGRNWLRTLGFPDGRGNQAWTYTKDGLPNTISTNNSNGGDVVTNSYDYNKRRLLEAETFGVNGQLWNLAYGYTPNGHLGSYTSPGLAVDHAPNALGQPTRAGAYATAVSYFPNGGMKQFTYGNGNKHTLAQNPRGLPDTSCDFAGSSCGAGAVLNDGYDYDSHGNVMGISDGRTGHRGDRTMTYDALDRLTQAVSPMFGTASYGYNALDNLTSVKVTGGSRARDHTYVYDAENRLGNIKNTVGGATVVGLGYDMQGNLANRNGVIHVFDQGNRLREVTGVEQYRYDGHGRRVLAVRDGQNLYSVYGQDGTLRFQRDERTGKTIDYVHLGGSLVAQVENAIALSTPTLTAPGSSMTGSYAVSWTTVPMATKYQLQERPNSGSWSTVHDAAGTSRAISGRAAGVWGYQVRACSATTCGSWSAEKTVTVQLPPTGVPTLTVPTSSTTGSYAVSWTTVAVATRYELQESVNGGTYATIQDNSGTSLAITGRQDGSWSYRVRACNPAGCAAYSAAKATQVTLPPSTVPTLTVPTSNTTGSYTVSWTSVTSATRYELEERLGTGAWAKVHDAAATSKAISGKASGSWGYRVRGCNGGACGAWSAIMAVAVTLPPTGVPALTAPATNSTGSYSVSWTTVAAATRYQLEERLGTGSWASIHDAAGTSKALSGKATGSWGYRVRACNAGGCAAYSTIATVAVTLPPTGVPTLTAPASGPNGNYTVSWTGVAAATRYELQERLGTGNWSTVHDAAGTSKAISGKAAGTWGYQVRACNAGGCAGWSTIKTVNVIHPPANPPSLTAPSTSSTGNYTVSWTTVATAARYELQERLGTGSWASIHDAAGTSKVLSGKATGSWGYRVRACNDAGCTAYTAEKKVEVLRPPAGIPALTAPATNTTGSYSVSWTTVATATTYQLQERLNSGSWSTIHDAAGTSKALSGKATGSWGYQVRACNGSGCGGWSAAKAVSVTRLPAVPAITYAHNHTTYQGDIVTPYCSVQWTSVPSATSYEMKASGGVIGLYGGAQTSVGGSQYCAPNYIVRACNAVGCSDWSSPPRIPTTSEEHVPPGGPLSVPASKEGEGE